MTRLSYAAAFALPLLALASCSSTPPPATEPPPAPVVEAPAPVGPGASLVRSVQTELSRLGYFKGAVDGVAGRQTSMAVRSFERAQKMRADGAVTQRLLAKLRGISNNAAAPADAAPAPADTMAPAAPAPAPK